jgi:hypothetical protein
VVNGNHNVQCATAEGRVCKCTGCGGSQHGWQGWLDQTSAGDEGRRRLRERFEGELAVTEQDSSRPAPKRRRELTTDLARLDIADWLAIPPELPKNELVEPYPSPVEQVTILAEEMTRGTWQEIATELDRGTADPAAVKRELANHGWCDLFVALAQAIETTQRAFNSIPVKAKAIVLAAPIQGSRTHVTEAVVNLVVDKVWDAFAAAAFGGIPLLDVLSNDDALRALRILAVFICPAPEEHEAVRQHALKPLGDDATKILTDQTKARLAALFAEWQTDGGTQQV